MAAITVTNTEWSILSELDTAITAATISGSAVFQEVVVTTAAWKAKESQLKNSPVCIIRYVGTVNDTDAPDDMRNCVVAVELIVAAKVAASATDEATRLQEALRLKASVMNAVEGTPPASASGCGDENFYHERIEWGEPSIDLEESDPWVVVYIPVEFGYALDSSTSH